MSSCQNKRSAKANLTVGCVIVIAVMVWASAASAADVTLAWDANTEPDLAGYVIYYGTASRDYPHSVDVGNTTSHTLAGLNDGQTYYFAATAYDANGNESAYSLELSHSVGSPPSPTDSDGDGLSDADESNIYGTNPNLADSDGDGLSDGVEVTIRHTNPLAADTDADGLSDGAEVNTHATDPRNADSDGDGLSDGVEVTTHHTDPLAADTDADGVGDGEEIANGSNPLVDDAPVNNAPFKPSLVVPNQNEIDVSLTPVLVTEEFADPDKQDTHARTHWQISTDAGFSYLIFDLISDRFLTTLPLHDAILSRNTAYYWRVRFTDSRALNSEWSDPFIFTTAVQSPDDQNMDGIPDAQEVTVPTDLDEDKVDDAQQLNIVCLNTIVSGVPIGMKWSNNVTAVETLSSSDGTEISETLNKPSRLPYGLISFKVYVANPGDTAEITFMSAEAFPADLSWYKYDLDNGWYDYSSHVVTSTNSKKIVLTLTDGGDGDADGVANGIIVDPSAVAMRSDSTSDSEAAYLNGDGDDDPSPSKASCFIAATAEPALLPVSFEGLGWLLSAPAAIACLLILVAAGVLPRRIRREKLK